MNYTKLFNPTRTPQTMASSSAQVPNAGGGYAFAVDKWTALRRFLILGSEGGTYYAGEQKLTVDNALNVIECIKEDGPRVVREVADVSRGGLAPKNSPAIFVLALAARQGNENTRQVAFSAIPVVCRIGTHLFEFAEYMNAMGGWGRGLRRAIGRWYTFKDVDDLAYQVVKYQQRNGWSHRDLLRLSHPKPPTAGLWEVMRWAVGKGIDESGPDIIIGFEQAKAAQSEKQVISAINRYELTREMIPTQFLKSATVWDALLPNTRIGALIRNLGNMGRVGLLEPGSDAVRTVAARLTDAEELRRGRIHPMALLLALGVYTGGKSRWGRGLWPIVPQVSDALDEAFYLAFGNVKPTGKLRIVGVDASTSMRATLGDNPITARHAALAMAMVSVHADPETIVLGFTGKDHVFPLDVSRRRRLDDNLKDFERQVRGVGTDAAGPYLWATAHKVQADAFELYTDNETWAGDIHPHQALELHRRQFGPSRQINVAMTPVGYSTNDPIDANSLNVVGFDASAPGVIRSFIRGEV